MAISTSQFCLVNSFEEPKHAYAWDALYDHYECDTQQIHKLMLKKQYLQTEMKEGTLIEVHIKYMKELTDKLAAIAWSTYRPLDLKKTK